MNTPLILSVSQLNKYIKSYFDSDSNLLNVFLSGEISNFTNHYRTGHLYFTLKDDASVVKAVMFRSSASKIKFMPENGMKVIVRGRVSVYEASGQYQVYVDDMQPDGIGALNIAFEQLKEKFSKEGLFDLSHKKQLPKYPQKVGVITSPTGAAVHDIMNVLGRRFPLAEVVFCPSLVQGDGAHIQLINALNKFNFKKSADVIIIGRGGGSIEDLWEFNNEDLARAIFNSEIPIISAVGHETDFTICDFVADLRAPTPSAAAELAVPDINDLKYNLSLLRSANYTNICNILGVQLARLQGIISKEHFKNPRNFIELQQMKLDGKCSTILNSYQKLINNEKIRYMEAVTNLSALNPMSVLLRGYSVVSNVDGKTINSIKNIKCTDNISVKFSDGTALCEVKEIL